MQVPLSFLGAGVYQGLLVRDSDEGPAAVRIEKTKLGPEQPVRIDLRDGGGFVGRFSR